MTRRAVNLPHVLCPACGGKAFARSVGKNTILFRELYYHCRNPDACGHQFVVEMVAVRTTRKSQFPAPLSVLPMSTFIHADNDRADNDNGPDHEPAASAVTTA